MFRWAVLVLAASPLIGDEFPIDPTPNSGPAWANKERPRSATISDITLIVWRDFRAGNADVYAARVDTTGAILDPIGIALTTSASDEAAPAVAVAGNNFVVTWASADGQIVARRVSLAGGLVDASAVPIFTAAARGRSPAVACDPASCRFVWVVEQTGQPRTIFTRTSTHALVGLTADVAVAPSATLDQADPRISANATVFVVAWANTASGASSIQAARYSAAGVALDPGGVAIANGPIDVKPRVASSSSKTMVAWIRNDGSLTAMWVLNTGALMP